jgi:hypothetical protein
MAAAKDRPTLVAAESFACEVNGQPWIAQAGITRVRSDHPVVKGREHLFVPDEPDIEEH